MKKNGPTIAHALVSTLREVADLVQNSSSAGCLPRLLHVLTGDAVGTNDNAARRMFQYFTSPDMASKISYSLVNFLCGAHQSNLTCHIAICSKRVKNPTRGDPICAACSRLYRHLMADYGEEFNLSLWSYVKITLEEAPVDECGQAYDLQKLYGETVLPQDIVDLYFAGPGPHSIRKELRIAICLVLCLSCVIAVLWAPIAPAFVSTFGCPIVYFTMPRASFN